MVGSDLRLGIYNASLMKNKGNMKWRTILGLIILYFAMWFNWQWIWGILFLIWMIPDLFTGVPYFIEPVSKKRSCQS